MNADSQPRSLKDRVEHPITEDDWELWQQRRSLSATMPITEADWKRWQEQQR